jgi:hypothetical protein
MEDVSILELFDTFAFSVLDCCADMAIAAIEKIGQSWEKKFVKHYCKFDARVIYLSQQGPHSKPAVHIGIMLYEINGRGGTKTVFLSSVEDGYSSMIHVLSKTIPGVHFSIRVTQKNELPGYFFRAVSGGEDLRFVYLMKDGAKWVFFEKGKPFYFEEVERYLSRIKTHRLSPEVISIYLDRIGYGSLSKTYWIDSAKDAILLATDGFVPWKKDGVSEQ